MKLKENIILIYLIARARIIRSERRITRPAGRDSRPTGRDSRPTGRDSRPTGRDSRPAGRDTGLLTFPRSVLYAKIKDRIAALKERRKW